LRSQIFSNPDGRTRECPMEYFPYVFAGGVVNGIGSRKIKNYYILCWFRRKTFLGVTIYSLICLGKRFDVLWF
jgi:hypothetical protein